MAELEPKPRPRVSCEGPSLLNIYRAPSKHQALFQGPGVYCSPNVSDIVKRVVSSSKSNQRRLCRARERSVRRRTTQAAEETDKKVPCEGNAAFGSGEPC